MVFEPFCFESFLDVNRLLIMLLGLSIQMYNAMPMHIYSRGPLLIFHVSTVNLFEFSGVQGLEDN